MHDKISALAYTSSGGAILFGLTANEFAALGGFVVAVLTFFVNIWFKWDERKRRRK